MIDYHMLDLKSVQIQSLDEHQDPIEHAFASGFLLNEPDGLFLYTCWHVVTGYDMYNLSDKHSTPRKFLELSLQRQSISQGGGYVLTGLKSFTIPLYNEQGKPVWIQTKQEQEFPMLNQIGIRVPAAHDIVKIPIPFHPSISSLQIIDNSTVFQIIPPVCSKMYIVGYPYGFSSLGEGQPSAIVLTRFVAAFRTKRPYELLLDGPGVPGMSGSPVFVEDSGKLKLFGVYTGVVYTDYVKSKSDIRSQLGSVSRLGIWQLREKE